MAAGPRRGLLRQGAGADGRFRRRVPVRRPQLSPRRSAGGAAVRRGPAAGGLRQGQERQEVPAQRGVRLGPLECIILTVNNDFMDAGGYAHEQLQ